MWLTHFLQRNRLIRPDATALSEPGRDCTWLELDRRTGALAAGLAERGLRRGDRVMVLAPNRIEVLELFFAASKIGAIVCPVNPAFQPSELLHVCGNVGPSILFGEAAALDALAATGCPRVLIGGAEYEAMCQQVPVEPLQLRQSDPAVIFSTSATTGRPKAVVVSHRSIMACYTGMAAETGMSGHDIMLNPCPLFHGSMVISLALLAAGGRLVLFREFTPQRFLSEAQRTRATRAFVVPSMLRFILAARAFASTDLGSLQEIMHGGAPMPVETLREALQRFPCAFRNIYGITEGGGTIAMLSSSDPQVHASLRDGGPPLASGRMMTGAHIAVLDDAGHALANGECGEICVRGDGLMDGYWNDPEATASVLTDGWLRTGDLGYLTDDGYIFLMDRKNDLIIRGGQNVYPAEIERVIRNEPGVADVAAMGIPHVDWGEVPLAFVVAERDAELDPADLVSACIRNLASYKRPVEVRLVEEIPRSAAGKILRRVLRERLAAETARPAGLVQ